MAVNKVEYYGRVLIDLTEDTVTPETLAKGITAHTATGEKITGTMESGAGEDLTAVIAEQAELIEELSTALDNKASGGGNATPLETCIVDIEANFLIYDDSEIDELLSFRVVCETLDGSVRKPTVFSREDFDESYRDNDVWGTDISASLRIPNVVKGSILSITGDWYTYDVSDIDAFTQLLLPDEEGGAYECGFSAVVNRDGIINVI